MGWSVTTWAARATRQRVLTLAACVGVIAVLLSLVGTSSAFGAVLLGTQTVSSGQDNDGAGRAEAFSAVASGSGAVGSLGVYIDSGSAATKVIVGLYSDSGGKPGSVLTQGTISSPTAGAWNTVSVSGASVTSGTRYWITILSPSGSGTVNFRDAASGTLSQGSSQSNLTALPTTWSPGPNWNNSPISAYAAASTGPVLSVTPNTVTIGGTTGGSDPPPVHVSVSNGGSGTLGFTASSDVSWLTVSPATGSAPQDLSVGATVSGLDSGTYTGHVTITASGAQGSPQVIPVTLILNSPSAPGDWPTIEHDPGRSGTAADETRITASNVSSMQQDWSTNLDGKVTAEPLYLGSVQVRGATHDVVIAATNQNTVYALDAASGAILWNRHLVASPASCGIPGGFGISGTPVVDRSTGRIYAVTDDGVLRTLSLLDGSDAAPPLTVVSNPATNYVWGGLTLVNGNLYFPTGSNGCDQSPWQGGIFEIAVTGGAPHVTKHWITVPSLPASTAGGGIWGYGGVSVDTTTGHVYAASADDGTGLSTQEGVTPYAASLLALDSNLNLLGWYQPSQATKYPCAPSTACDQDFASTPLVFHPPGCPTMLAAGNKNGNLYIVSEANLEADGGTDASHVQAIQLSPAADDLGLGGLYGTPVYSPATNMLYVVDAGPGINGIAGGLIALSVHPDCSLSVAWSQAVGGTPVSDSPNSIPTLANGVVFVGGNDGSVSAFDAATGTRLWNSGSKGFAVYAAPTVANGRVFAGVWSGGSGSDTGSVQAWSVPTSPVLGLSPTSLSFSATIGGANPPSQSVSVTNKGVGSLSFTASSDSSWLTVTPTSGTAPATLTVQTDITGLSTGTYTGAVTVTPSSGAPKKINVTLNVNPSGPVPLLGDGNVEATVDSDAGGQAEAFPATASASGNVTQLRVYVDQSNTASALVAGLYTDSSGRPGQLLAQGTLNNPAGGAWSTMTLPATAVTSGSTYWIAVLSPSGSGTLSFRDRLGGGTSVGSASKTLQSLPATWASGPIWSSSNLSAVGLG